MKKNYYLASVLCIVVGMIAQQTTFGSTLNHVEGANFKKGGKKISDSIVLKSPDKNINVVVFTDNANELKYSVSLKNEPVIMASRLGLILSHGDMGSNVSFSSIDSVTVNETYPWRGNHSTARNHYNEKLIGMTHSGGKTVFLKVRAFNDGIAFRYIVREPGTVTGEATRFKIPEGSTVWFQNNAKVYEAMHQHKRISDITSDDVSGPPLTIELPNGKGYASITEGALINYSGMSLRGEGNNTFHTQFVHDSSWTISDAINSPWRIIMIGSDLNTLVNSDIVNNVSPAYNKTIFPQGFDTDWIKPGRCTWSWLGGGGVTYDNMKAYSTLCGQLEMEYNLVDEGWEHWEPWGTFNQIKSLITYAKTQNVQTWVWKSAFERYGIPGIYEQSARRDFFKKMNEIGVSGIKIDFIESESKDISNFIQQTLADAADYKLMIDFHGMAKPTGESRTWPNEMTREGVYGLESGGGTPKWATLNAIINFTRLLAGHCDYTPMNFSGLHAETTMAHQIATVVLYTSPLMVLGEHPSKILNSPAVDIIKSIPTVWDETRVLPQSKIGDLVVFARRSGSTWFLSAINGNSNTGKTVDIDLSFLNSGEYEVNYCADKEDVEQVFQKGIGTHANSVIKYNLGGNYKAFQAVVGVDAEVTGNGTVTFQVMADDIELSKTNAVTRTDVPKLVSVDVTGKQMLSLIANDSGDGVNYDHANWADAKLISSDGTVTYLSDLEWESATTDWGEVQKDSSTDKNKMKFITNGVNVGKDAVQGKSMYKIVMRPAGGFLGVFSKKTNK